MTQTLSQPAPDHPDLSLAAVFGGPPRATAFIVTIYGDAVAPRGGALSMRSLIEIGAAHGLSESLVRTAVSRLVGAGRLEGERIGRSSFYRLTADAEAEFAAAARILYDPPPVPRGWLLAVCDAPPGEGWAAIGGGICAAPDRGDVARAGGLTFVADVIAGAQDLPGFAAAHWPVSEVAAAYAQLLEDCAALFANGAALGDLAPEVALALRLRLVHAYRAAALADPRLPAQALPGDWPGIRARAGFVSAYLALSSGADRAVAQLLEDAAGPLPQETEATRERYRRLERQSVTPI